MDKQYLVLSNSPSFSIHVSIFYCEIIINLQDVAEIVQRPRYTSPSFPATVLNFSEVQVISSAFDGPVFGVVPKEASLYERSSRFPPLVSFRHFVY